MPIHAIPLHLMILKVMSAVPGPSGARERFGVSQACGIVFFSFPTEYGEVNAGCVVSYTWTNPLGLNHERGLICGRLTLK